MHKEAVAVIALSAVTGIACSRPAPEPRPAETRPSSSASQGAAAGTVVAEVDGEPITLGEVDAKAAQALMQVREQEYEARKDALDELLSERILAREAKARGLTRDELLKREVEDKAPTPARQEISRVYMENKARMGGRSEKEMTPQIEASLRRDSIVNQGRLYMSELRSKARVKVSLAQPRTAVPISPDAMALGPADAPVTLVEYSDYLCPYCQRAEGVVEMILNRYKDKVRFVHRDFLLGRPRSLEVARAALCAGDQGKFWEYRRALLSKPTGWGDPELIAHAKELSLDTGRFAACLRDNRHDAAIQASSAEGQRLGVSGTPTFFINGRRMTGVRSPEQFQEVIDGEL